MPEVGSQERHTEEFVKLTFELCKQLTTLSTAGALIVLAVYRELTFGEKLLAATLVLFGLTVIVSLMIMAAGTTYFTARGRASRERGVSIPVEPILLWGSWSAASLFVAGVWSFMVFLLDWHEWVIPILAGVLMALLAVPVRARLSRGMPRP